MVKLFTEERIAKIKYDCRCFTERAKPEIYRIVTDSTYAEVRSQIDELYSSLIEDKDKNSQLANMLIKHEQFWNAYNELRIGAAFKSLGHEIEYTPQIEHNGNPQTPDWLVKPIDGTQPFYVDVFTPNPAIAMVQEEQGWQALENLVENKIRGVGIVIQAFPQIKPPNSRDAKFLVRRIDAWLSSTKRHKDEFIAFDPGNYEEITNPERQWGNTIRFIVSEVMDNCRERGWCVPPLYSHLVDTRRLRDKLQEKVLKYRNALMNIATPLVICCVPHPDVLFDHTSMRMVLNGNTGLKVIPDGRLIECNLGDGLYNGRDRIHPILSTVLWFDEKYKWFSANDEPIFEPIGVYQNPNALIPLPFETFNFYR